jgi:hypothetical protein
MQTELQDVVNRARDVLRQSKIREIRKLDIERVEESIALRGYASTIYHKQLVQELCPQGTRWRRSLESDPGSHPLPQRTVDAGTF